MTPFADIEPVDYLWVAPDGTGPGTQDQPMGSIKEAMAVALPGTAVMVRAGTYVERVDIAHGGRDDLPIWLISADGRGAARVESSSTAGGTIWGFGVANLVIQGFEVHAPSGINGTGIQFGGAGTPLYKSPSRNIVIEDNIVYEGGNDGIKIHQADNVHIIGNTVRNSGDDNIDFVAVNNSVIAGNDVGDSHGISSILVKGGSTDVRIEANNVHGARVDGIVIGGYTGNQFTRPGYDEFEAHRVTAINNHVHDVGKRDINILGGNEILVTGNWLEASKIGYPSDINLEANENILPNFTERVSVVDNLFGRPDAIMVNEGQDRDLVIQGNWVSGRWLGSAGLGAPLGQTPYEVVGGERPDGLGTNLSDRFDGTDDREWFIGNGGTDALHGAGGMDRLDGGNGNDLLNGGSETDTLLGGAGNDRYVVDSRREALLEPATGGGIDTVESSVSWTLGDQFENLVLTGDSLLDGVGTAANNSLIGNAAANRLSAGAGNDLIMAGTGDDWLSGGAGRDSLLGEGGSDRIDGGPDNDQLAGGVGDDVLDGGAGSDLMDGDSGNDVYFVNGLGDLITEQPEAGQDMVFSAVSYVLPAEIEALRLTGGTGIDGAGNGLANTIIGNGGANTIAGGGGDDWMAGGDSSDMLAAGSGNDLLEGGSGDDLLDGGSGDDILVGDAGADVLSGGPGRDTFVLRFGDAAGDRIDDFQSGGNEGDMLRLEGYDPGATLVPEGSIWMIQTPEGEVESFELSGVSELAPGDVLFV